MSVVIKRVGEHTIFIDNDKVLSSIGTFIVACLSGFFIIFAAVGIATGYPVAMFVALVGSSIVGGGFFCKKISNEDTLLYNPVYRVYTDILTIPSCYVSKYIQIVDQWKVCAAVRELEAKINEYEAPDVTLNQLAEGCKEKGES